MEYSEIKFDCKHFKGEYPCLPNKSRGKVCNQCDEYIKISKNILIIKLGAIGDVLRTTPLILKFRLCYPDCHLTWITNYPEILSNSGVDVVLKHDFMSNAVVKEMKFDIAANLDKDKDVCILLSKIDAKEKLGFIWNDGHIDGINEAAKKKIITGLFDDLSRTNAKSYQEEIFEICNFKFNKEEYIINLSKELDQKWNKLKIDANGKKIIGLNTGCGKRWLTRLWPKDYWVEFIFLLQKNNYFPLLLGGPDENLSNIEFSKITNAYYPGTFGLEEFVALTNQCDVILTAVTMMMHIATGLQKKLILFNNIFNKNEFELYGRGIIVEPSSGCDCYYGVKCSRSKHCMLDIKPEYVLQSLINLIG